MKKSFALSLSALLLTQFPALPSQAETCEGDFCEVTFSLSGEIVQWQVPAGVSELDFEIAGGSGGRGGLGGKVTGTLSNLPETLFIAVGGAGAVGSLAAGGFNGGGNAGGFRTNEGAGGGASDIRFGPALADRVVVAGGGGGTGGFSGAPGGAGGGLVGANGQSGQGGGGQGGSQTSGGSGGSSNGGTLSTPGGFGFGGTGGNSPNAGGGGGGGGWYGGGGGGADDDTCCSDGGGGGGGSSFALASSTSSVFHLQGAQSGDGFIRLSYQKEQSVIGFAGLQQGQTAIFTLELLLPQSLELTNFDASQARCAFFELENAGSTVRLLGTGCEHGEHSLALKSGALGAGLPNQDLVVTLDFDALGPMFFWSEARVDHLQGTILIDYEITEAQLVREAILVQGCEVVEVDGAEIALADCGSDEVLISIAAGVLVDDFGNTGPADTMSQQIFFDRVPPELSFLNPVSDLVLGTHEVELVLSEPAVLDLERIQMISDTACSFQTEPTSSGYLLSSACGYGDFSYIVPVGSLVDLVGNLGPAQEVRFDFVLVEPIPESVQPEPESAPVLSPVPEGPEAQLPVQENAPGESEPVLEVEPIQQPALSPETPVETEPGNAVQPQLTPESQESAAVAVELQEAAQPDVGIEISENVLPKPMPGAEEQATEVFAQQLAAGPEVIQDSESNFLTPWALALLGIALLGAMVFFGYRLIGR